MARKKNRNRHQKAAFRAGEQRVRGEEIDHLIALAGSLDPADRLQAAQNLCPCHVRRRIDEAWDALYRMMEDPDVRVRREYEIEIPGGNGLARFGWICRACAGEEKPT